MPLILCKLPNAAAVINGVEFKKTDAGMLSGEVSDEAAELFAAIPGYEVVQPQGKAKGGKAAPAAEPAAEPEPAAE